MQPSYHEGIRGLAGKDDIWAANQKEQGNLEGYTDMTDLETNYEDSK